MQKSVSIGWGELIDDMKRIRYAYVNLSKSHSIVYENSDLKRCADEIVGGLKNLGWEKTGYATIGFLPMKPRWDGETLINGDVKMSDWWNARKSAAFYNCVTHEIIHASGVDDESATDILATEACSQLAMGGDKKYEAAALRRIFGWLYWSMEIKANEEGVPKRWKKDFENTTHLKLRTENGRFKIDYSGFGDDVFEHYDEGEKCYHLGYNLDICKQYGLTPYLKLKKAEKSRKTLVPIDYRKSHVFSFADESSEEMSVLSTKETPVYCDIGATLDVFRCNGERRNAARAFDFGAIK